MIDKEILAIQKVATAVRGFRAEQVERIFEYIRSRIACEPQWLAPMAKTPLEVRDDKVMEILNKYFVQFGKGSLGKLKPEWYASYVAEIHGSKFIGAIKLLRDVTGLGVKDAKDVTDAVRGLPEFANGEKS